MNENRLIMYENICLYHEEDIYVWPDGEWLLKSEYDEEEHRYKGDDFKIIKYEDSRDGK